jgi:predicted dehydrogenase
MTVIKLGIIGAGLAVRNLHWPVLRKMSKKVQVVAVASRTKRKAEELARLVGAARSYDDYHSLLADPEVEAVLSGVPIELNAPILMEALHAGKHVLAEKPIAATVHEARQVLELCSRTDRVVAIAENFRYWENLIWARQLVSSGEIGEVFAFQLDVRFDLDASFRQPGMERPWRKFPSHPGGFVLDAGIHAIAGLREVLGDVTELTAELLDRHPVVQGPDALLMQLKLSNGAVGHYFTCYTAKVERETIFDLSVYGSRGSLKITEGELMGVGDSSKLPKDFKAPDFDRGYRLQWQNFLNAVGGEEAVVATPGKAYGDLVVIDAALRSAKTGQEIRLEPKDFNWP